MNKKDLKYLWETQKQKEKEENQNYRINLITGQPEDKKVAKRFLN